MKKYLVKPYFFLVIFIVFEVICRGWIFLSTNGNSIALELPFYDYFGPESHRMSGLKTEFTIMFLCILVERVLGVFAIVWFLIRILLQGKNKK